MSQDTRTITTINTSQIEHRGEKDSLHKLLAKRVLVEKEFEALGHTYRHGPYYRTFEHRVIRPVLKTGLRLSGLYQRGLTNALSPVVQRVVMRFANLPRELEGFEVLHLSDFHIDGTPGLADALATAIAPLRPDVCVLTGDYRFEDRGECEAVYPLMEEVIGSIHARFGVYGILGNHDPSEMAMRLEDFGIRMLVNEAAPVGESSDPLWVLGVDDPFDYRCDDLQKAQSGVPRGSFQILLAHAPELYEEAAAAGINLYLTGHTHGGQIRLPGVGALRQNAKCPRAYARGHWRHAEMQGYTSSGVGCSSLPVRFNCPPELVMIELRRS